MTPAASSAFRLADPELPRLEALARELAAALAGLQGRSPAPSGPPGAQALLRLLRGAGQPQDELLLGVPVQDARLVAVTVASRMVPHLIGAVRSEGRLVVVPLDEEEVVVLVPDLPKEAGVARSRMAAQRVARLVVRHVAQAEVGVSSLVHVVGDLPLALEEARSVRGAPAAFADDHWATLAADRLAAHVGQCLTVSNPLRALASHDARQGGDLVRTVAVWLAHDGNVPATAAAMTLHPNTVRYRLNRVREVSGLDLTDPDARLVAQLLLRSHH